MHLADNYSNPNDVYVSDFTRGILSQYQRLAAGGRPTFAPGTETYKGKYTLNISPNITIAIEENDPQTSISAVEWDSDKKQDWTRAITIESHKFLGLLTPHKVSEGNKGTDTSETKILTDGTNGLELVIMQFDGNEFHQERKPLPGNFYPSIYQDIANAIYTDFKKSR